MAKESLKDHKKDKRAVELGALSGEVEVEDAGLGRGNRRAGRLTTEYCSVSNIPFLSEAAKSVTSSTEREEYQNRGHCIY